MTQKVSQAMLSDTYVKPADLSDAAYRTVGSGADEIPDTEILDTRLNTSGNLTAAASLDYQADDVVINTGDFSADPFTLKCRKIGDVVTIGTDAPVTHPSEATPSALGVVPTQYRPVQEQYYSVIYISPSLICYVTITSSGSILLGYKDYAGADVLRTDSAGPLNITYSV